MNMKLASLAVLATFASVAFAEEAAPAVAPAAPVAEPVAAAPANETVATEVKADAAYQNLEKEVPESTAPAAEAAPVAEPNTETAQAPAAPVAEPAPAAVAEQSAAEPVAAEVAPVAVRNETNAVAAPVAVRNGESSTTQPVVSSQPAAQRPVYVEHVYVNADGIPVRTVYVAQQTQQDTVTMDQLRGLYPIKFKIGAQATINTYYLSNGEYGNWDEESFDGLSWRAGISALIPLNEYTMGIKVGVLYEQSNASENYYVNSVATHFKFEQKKLDIPALFTFKASGSRFYFDMGVQLSIPLQDELKVSYTDSTTSKKVSSKADMIDEDYRNSLDWSLLFGFSIMANKYISFDVRAELGMSDLYDGYLSASGEDNAIDLNLGASSFGVGVTLYPF